MKVGKIFLWVAIFFLVSPVSLVVAQVKSVNAYELFWPIVAGKTRADSVYTLKILAEEIKGKFKFGKALQSDYSLLLAIKRVLEAEKLLQEDKPELANETLKQAELKLQMTKDLKADISTLPSLIEARMRQRVQGLDQFLVWLGKNQNKEFREKTDSLHNIVLQIF